MIAYSGDYIADSTCSNNGTTCSNEVYIYYADSSICWESLKDVNLDDFKATKKDCDLPTFRETIRQPIPRSQCYWKPWRMNRLIGKREKRIGLKF